MPPEFTDDLMLRDELLARGVAQADIEPWDAAVDWSSYDLVVVRSPWDYAGRRAEFLAWAESVAPRIENSAEVLRWNSDKTYLADLAEMDIPVVPTRFLEPGEEWLPEPAEFVVKPSVSAGGRDTGRFGPDLAREATALIGLIHESGRTAMVQPYLASVDTTGETAVVFVAGEPSHVLKKRAVLRPDEVAPVRTDGIGAAEVMYDPELVRAGSAEPDELALARRIMAGVSERFARTPLYGRVDMVRDDSGDPVLLELELVEPNLYLGEAPRATGRLAEAITSRAG